ncbi:hypothetical protein [Methylocystis heyeri]|uniref:hypothetical protein n=1 Tax=Methylocystis heyeri TaxID=391905 RepID=UPI001FE80AEB|nr:hypothetical protein [Methylocystis heyeri]
MVSQFEAMALQVNEATREIDDAMLVAEHNARKAEECEHRTQQETARANALAAELEEERRTRVKIAAEFAHYRDVVQHAPVDDPWGQLGRAASQIVNDRVAWARAKIPPDSPLLPWFDRAVELAKTAGRQAWKWGKAFYLWAKPRVIEAWKWLRSEIARRMSRE